MEAKGVDGMDLLTYRYTGDAPKLLQEVVEAISVPMVSAGSIDSYDRIAEVRDTGTWGFTIGTAFFEKKFIPDGSFEANMMAVWDWLQENGMPD
jgi:phosphoribosylformimino-5-aminoimidazole carboxamide ribonucleotide (ProFAR) isomerase